MPEWLSLFLVLCWLRFVEFLSYRRAGALVFHGRPNTARAVVPRGGVDEIGRAGLAVGNPFDPFGGVFQSGTALAGTLDPNGLRARLSAYRKAVDPLLRAEVALSIHLFLVMPVVWTIVGIARSWPYLLGGLIVLHAVTVVAFLQAYRKIFGREDRWASALPLILAPPIATAGHVALTKRIARDVHPVAAAFELCDDEAFRGVAAPYLRRVEFPAGGEEGPADTPPGRWMELRTLVAQRLGSIDSLLLAPARRSETAEAYCPRCLAEYAGAADVCSDCEGVALKRFA
jgi:hypothetical protein